MARITTCGAYLVNGETTQSAPPNALIDFSMKVVLANGDDVDHEVTVVGTVDGAEFDRVTTVISPNGGSIRLEGQVQTGTVDLQPGHQLVSDVALEPTGGGSGGDSTDDTTDDSGGCTTDADCPAGEICFQGLCTPSTGDAPRPIERRERGEVASRRRALEQLDPVGAFPE